MLDKVQRRPELFEILQVLVDLGGFDPCENGAESQDRLWNSGGSPPSFLAADDGASIDWRQGFARTFLERDIPQLGISVPAETLRRFWTMIAHYHGQVWNAAVFDLLVTARGRWYGFEFSRASHECHEEAEEIVSRSLC